MIPFKDRSVEIGQRVRVYYHFRSKVFSIQDADTKLVLGHSPTVVLENVIFDVSEAGRKRVLREQRKNVHAYIIGDLVGFTYSDDISKMVEVSYNPYFNEKFMATHVDLPIEEASFAVLSGKKAYI